MEITVKTILVILYIAMLFFILKEVIKKIKWKKRVGKYYRVRIKRLIPGKTNYNNFLQINSQHIFSARIISYNSDRYEVEFNYGLHKERRIGFLHSGHVDNGYEITEEQYENTL